MRFFHANCFKRKGQMKIQEMAFVLIAIMIFFAIVALFYINFRVSGLRQGAEIQRGEEAQEMVKKIAAMPEFALTARECESCIDMDKVMALKEKKEYQNFWGLDYLRIESIYPQKPEKECIRGNYPDCTSITLINKSKDFGSAKSAFVALCRNEFLQQGYIKCELGKVYAAEKGIK